MPDDFLSGATRLGPGGGGVTPSAPISGPLGQGRPQISAIRGKSVEMQFPGVDQPRNLSEDQDLAAQVEDLTAQLNMMDDAASAYNAREKKSTRFDKVINSLTTATDADPQLAEQARNWADYGKMHYGHMRSDRQQIFANASSIRQIIYGLVRQQMKLRAFQGIRDIEDHIPGPLDSDELLADKLAFWRDRANRARYELQERGVQVHGTQGYKSTYGASAGKGVGSTWKPGPTISIPGWSGTVPFNIKARVGTDIKDMRLLDDKGKWHYYDPAVRAWVEFGK